MRVLYISKAMTTAAYRDKLRRLAAQVELRAIAPERWGARPADRVTADQPWMQLVPAAFAGHNHFHLYRRARRMFNGRRPDLVHIDEEPYSAVTAQLARHCTRRGLPFVFFAWQNIEKRIFPPFDAMRNYVFRHARGGIAGNDEAAAVLRAWGWDGPLAVIPQMGVDTGLFRPDPEARRELRARLQLNDDVFLIGYGGRLLREKGVHLLIEALRALPGAKLLILGDGPDRANLLEMARAAGVADRVRMHGAVDSREIARLLPALDVLVLPSLTTPGWKEQFGRILAEAMACEVPVVGSSSGEIPHVIADAGLVFAEGSVPELTAALQRLADSPRLRSELGRRGRARVLEHYTNERIARDTVRFYESLLNGGAS